MEILAEQIRGPVENPKWNHPSLRDFGGRIATHLAVKRDGSRKKDRAVREGLRIAFDVLQAGNVRDFRNETAKHGLRLLGQRSLMRSELDR